MPFVEVVYARDDALDPEAVAEFATELRRVFADAVATRPEQLRLAIQRIPVEQTIEVLDVPRADRGRK